MPTNHLQTYLSRWGLTDPQPLISTATSEIYIVHHQGEQAILKLLTNVGMIDERGGPPALAHWGGRGAVRLLAHDQGAHLLEYAEGDDLLALVKAGRDTEATGIIGETLRQLHSAQASSPPPGLIPLRQRFRSLFERARAEPQSIYRRGQPWRIGSCIHRVRSASCMAICTIKTSGIRLGGVGWRSTPKDSMVSARSTPPIASVTRSPGLI